jgi:hypothetical protein
MKRAHSRQRNRTVRLYLALRHEAWMAASAPWRFMVIPGAGCRRTGATWAPSSKLGAAGAATGYAAIWAVTERPDPCIFADERRGPADRADRRILGRQVAGMVVAV